jgi:hypothetical protein
MQTQIPSGLQALMQASQVLSSQASPTAPGPQGPQPTIAERVNQQIKQVAQPQPPQGGIAGLTPNMQEIGKQAGVAGQIMAQRQAQQQQQAQNPQAVAQMAAQMLQSKGVAGLPSNMGFKEGGIIGFDGEERSDVPAPNVPGMDKLMEIMKNAEGTEIASTDNQVALQALEDARKRLYSYGLKQRRDDPEGFVAAQNQFNAAENAYRKAKREQFSSETGPAGALGKTLSPAASPVAAQAYPDELRRGRATTPGIGIPAALPVKDAAVNPPPTAPSMAAATAAAPVKAGIPTVTIPETKIDTSGIAEPTMKGALEGARQIVTGNADQTIKDLKAIRDEREKIKAGMTDLNAEEIKALEEDRAARRQLAASKAERDQFNRVQSFFRDLYTRGDSYSNVQAGIFARDEAERLAEKEHKKAVILLKKAQQAEKLGDLDRKAQYLKEYQDIKDKETTLLTQAAQISARIDESKYGKKMDAASTQAQIDSANVRTAVEINQRNQALQANLDIERQKVAGMSEERKNSRQGQALTAALGRLNDATQNLTKVSSQNETKLAMKDSKDPTAQAMYKQAEKNVSTAEATYQEAKRVFDSIAAEALKGYATTPAKPAGGINAAAAAAELARRQQKQ